MESHAVGPGQSDTSPPGQRTWQFSLRGMMVLVLGVAVGLSATRLKDAAWSDGLLVAAATWIALGLLNQVRDLWKTFAGRRDLPEGIARGWRLAAAGRLAVIGLLAACFTVEVLLDRGILSLPERPDDFWNPGAQLWVAVFGLAVLLAVWIVPAPIRTRRRSIWSLALGLCGWPAAIGCCLLVWSNQTFVHWLVHLACYGIDAAAPPQVADLPVIAYSPAVNRLFLWLSFAASGLAVVSLGLAGQWARHWSRSRRARFCWAALVLGNLAMVGGIAIWITTSGFRAVSVRMFEAWEIGPWHRWLTALVVVLILATVEAYRLLPSPSEAPGAWDSAWRRHPRSYYHERSSVLGILAVGAVAEIVVHLHRASMGGLVSFDLLDAFWFPLTYLGLALVLLAGQRALAALFRREGTCLSLPRVPSLPCFCAVWLATLATILLAIPLLAALSFAVWLSPWYLL